MNKEREIPSSRVDPQSELIIKQYKGNKNLTERTE